MSKMSELSRTPIDIPSVRVVRGYEFYVKKSVLNHGVNREFVERQVKDELTSDLTRERGSGIVLYHSISFLKSPYTLKPMQFTVIIMQIANFKKFSFIKGRCGRTRWQILC